jgi:diguanylate cyclase (GGDEF)-like protein
MTSDAKDAKKTPDADEVGDDLSPSIRRGDSPTEITESTMSNNVLKPSSGVFESRVFRPVLICLTGSQRGQRRSLTGPSLIIGRSMGCEWQLEDTASSRQHVRIEYENFKSSSEMPRCFITDLGSRNGTQVNGHEITGRTPLRERDRILIGSTVIGFFVRDEGELRHDESLYLSATSDVLTGLDNRRQLRVHLRHQLARARRQYRPVSFLLLDLDHFKVINDQFGHDVGDEALRHVAQLLRNGLREGDLVARWGGEEFAICLPETDVAEASMLAERLRVAIEKNPLAIEGSSIGMTTSIGVTTFRPGDGADSLFQRADHMLYRAKEQGRNCVVVDTTGETGEGHTA